MRTALQLKQIAINTHDRDAMFKILLEAIELAEYCEHREVLQTERVKKLQEQNARQMQMIENLEKTLWRSK